MSKVTKNTKKSSKEDNSFLRNIVFVIVAIIVIILIFALSLNTGKATNFDINNYNNISVIGINEFQASLNYDGTSIIFFCNSDEEKCQKEIKDLNEIGKENNLNFEYVNTIELVDSELEALENISDIFKENKYPNLVIIKSGKIVNNNNTYLTKSEIEDILKSYEVI